MMMIKWPLFVLGRYEAMYWRYFKNHRNYADKPKYKSLKEECMNNVIYAIDIKTYYDVLHKALVYTQSYQGRALKAADGGDMNNQFGIPVSLPISVAHIVTLMMYCNYTDLQRNYKQFGCREASENETIAEFILKNQQIGHWYKLLYEAIMCYGTQVKHGQIFYTGINIAVSFDTFAPQFKSPFSTTVDWNVANRFSEGSGIVLQLEPLSSSLDMYFNVEWISNYREERERLFCRATKLRVIDIQYAIGTDMQRNNMYLRAFSLWSAVFEGYYFVFEFTQKNRKQTELTLLCLILNYKENNGIKNESNASRLDIPIYIQQLFYHLVHQLSKEECIFINPSEYSLLKTSLQNQLLSKEQEPLALSPFLQSLDIKPSNVECMHQYIWMLTKEQFDRLKSGQKGVFVMSGDYNFRNTVVFELGIRDRTSDEHTSFKLRIKDSQTSTVSVMFSIAVDELKWLSNGWKFNDLKR
eukprot:519078_1